MSKSRVITISSLRYLKAEQLRQLITGDGASKIAVIDVRDNDHVGGHIKSSQWVPISQLDARMPELLRVNADKDQVVFHCMLSQQRGPKAALAYARAKAREADKQTENSASSPNNRLGQEICVLEGGFSSWQQSYGQDSTLTENYRKDLWDMELL